jgi:hypothetical protein
MDIGQVAHANGEILRGPLVCYFHMTPGSVRIEKHEQISGAVTSILAILLTYFPQLSACDTNHEHFDLVVRSDGSK